MFIRQNPFFSTFILNSKTSIEMKKESKKPSFSKFRVAKINRPDYIVGGGGGDGDDATLGDTNKDKCELKSTVIRKK